jgi:hypothetical protein
MCCGSVQFFSSVCVYTGFYILQPVIFIKHIKNQTKHLPRGQKYKETVLHTNFHKAINTYTRNPGHAKHTPFLFRKRHNNAHHVPMVVMACAAKSAHGDGASERVKPRQNAS